MSNVGKIKRYSRRFRRLFQGLFYLVPLLIGAYWSIFNWLPADMKLGLLPGGVPVSELPLVSLALGFVVSMVPVGVAMLGINYLARLFALYEEGRIFTGDNVRCLRNLGKTMMAWCAAGILFDPLASMALTMHHPPGQRILTIGLGSPDLTTFLVGGMIMVVAWVMDEGRRLQDEQNLTV